MANVDGVGKGERQGKRVTADANYCFQQQGREGQEDSVASVTGACAGGSHGARKGGSALR